MLRDATPEDHPALQSIFRQASLSNEGDRPRRGIGRALISDAARLASEAGCSAIVVTANPHARAFYAAAGFRGCDTVKTPLGVGTRLRLPLPSAGASHGSPIPVARLTV